MKRTEVFTKKIIPRQYHSKALYLYDYLKSLYLFGFKYQCNFCNGHFRKLLPTGLIKDIALNLTGGILLFFMSQMLFHRPGEIGLLVHN